MSSRLHYFQTSTSASAVSLPFALPELLADWRTLRSAMARTMPPEFSRDEWAYLINFVASENLQQVVERAFGAACESPTQSVAAIYRPRGDVAVWLPQNVSLLGPLVLVLLSLTGNSVRMKASSRATDLTAAWRSFALEHLSQGTLRNYLETRIELARFERDDPRNLQWAADAMIRIVFGSDAAAAAIEALPHPVASASFAFTDHQSQSWIEHDCATQDTLVNLIKVFSIYGQAGCTSPRRAVIIGGTIDDCRRIARELRAMWPQVLTSDPPMHLASQNVMARQLAAAHGWHAELVERNRAVIAVGEIDLPPVESLMTLAIVPASAEQAARALPTNIQTIGHALSDAGDPRWLKRIADSRVKRFVPLEQMHYFGPTWDGWSFWRQMFEEVALTS